MRLGLMPLWKAGWLALLFGAALPASAPAQFSIARPAYGVPEFALTGGTFRAEIKAVAGLTNTLWTVLLTNDLRAWTGTVEQARYGAYVDNNTVTGYLLTVRTPADISPETFKLIVTHAGAGGGRATNLNAVGVLQNFETNFYILHYADPQAEAYEPSDPLTGMYGTHGSIREILWHAPALGLIHPRFMFDTGDELDNAYGTSAARYQEYIDAMCRIGVPVFATRGNNDNAISTATWRSTIGVETYTVALGSFLVCQKDYNENNYTAWFTNNYAASFTNASIAYRLFGQHFPAGGTAWLPAAGQYPSLMLVGHGHANTVIQSVPYPILETRQACNKGSVGLFEFTKSGTNWSCATVSNPWFQVMNTGAVSYLVNTFSRTNNGSCSTNEAVITNLLPRTFADGRVRFLLRYSETGFTVSNGVKLAEYAYNGGSNQAVVVQVYIASNAVTRVSVRPASADADGDGMPDAWEMLHFGSVSAFAGGAADDYDGDGLCNEHEYRAGTNPTNAASVFAVAQIFSPASNLFVFSWSSESNKRYGVLAGSNLNGGVTQQIATNLTAHPPLNTHTATVSGFRSRFFRIKLEE